MRGFSQEDQLKTAQPPQHWQLPNNHKSWKPPPLIRIQLSYPSQIILRQVKLIFHFAGIYLGKCARIQSADRLRGAPILRSQPALRQQIIHSKYRSKSEGMLGPLYLYPDCGTASSHCSRGSFRRIYGGFYCTTSTLYFTILSLKSFSVTRSCSNFTSAPSSFKLYANACK